MNHNEQRTANNLLKALAGSGGSVTVATNQAYPNSGGGVPQPSTADCPVPVPTESVTLNLNNVAGGGGDEIVQFTVTNGSGVDSDLVIGSLAARPGVALDTGLTADSASDLAGVVDDFGAAVAKIQFFSDWAVSHGFLLSHIRIFGASVAQVGTPIEPFGISPNGDVKKIRGMITKQNNDYNYVELIGCSLAINTAYGFMYNLQDGETVTIELRYTAVGMAEQMTTQTIL